MYIDIGMDVGVGWDTCGSRTGGGRKYGEVGAFPEFQVIHW